MATKIEQEVSAQEQVNSPTGKIDLDKLRLQQDFNQMSGVKKLVTTAPVRKPSRQDFIRVHPSPGMQLQTGVIELKEDREHYLVDHQLWPELLGEITPKILLTTINRQGVLFLWPIRLPGEDGRLDNWNQSALEAAKLAETKWVRLSANMSLGAYEVYEAVGELPEPNWPEISFEEIIQLAFKGRFVNTMEHTVIKRLIGAC
jgi:hypothetical protein